MGENRDKWVREHGEYPRWVLGVRSDRGAFFCLDHATGVKRRKTYTLAGDYEAERARCATCERPLRRAEKFLTLTEADIPASGEDR